MSSDPPKVTDVQDEPLKEQIEENLRALYDETLDEALPERFLDLLQQLEEKAEK